MPGTCGRIAQIPRTRTSTGTPAMEARYRASMTFRRRWSCANRTRAGRPASWLAISLSMRSSRPFTDRVRSDEQTMVLGVHRVARELIEEVRDVLADLFVDGQQPEVLIKPGGLRVVVPGADVAVAPKPLAVVAHDHRQLAVGLQADQPVTTCTPARSKFSRPLMFALSHRNGP